MTTNERLDALEQRMDEWESALGSGDPLGAAQRLVANRKAKLAEVNDPAKLTTAKIQEISGDDGTDTAENSANKDVAEGLKQAKADAKPSKDTKTPKTQPGAGGARG